jgi:hypothetical protein
MGVDTIDDGVRAWPFRAWCKLNNISPSTGYLESKSGRLVINKVRGKSIVTVETDQRWRESLPRLHKKAAR